MSEAIPPLPNTPSWRGAQLKHRDNFTFTFNLSMPRSSELSLPFRFSDQRFVCIFNLSHP
jgi:hypothetical protein